MTDDRQDKALLPAGLHDVLPPEADHEAQLITSLMEAFAANGYERVRPPLVEFETTLLGASGPEMAEHIFRIMDPTSQQMMGVRADMTPQVARIAATRLANMPRPLRLSYNGQVLIVRGNQLRPERQFAQAGVELIGGDTVSADVEIVSLAVEALASIGIDNPTVDLAAPALITRILEIDGTPEGTARNIRAALDHKDSGNVKELAGNWASTFVQLIEAAGPVDQALPRLAEVHLPDAAETEVTRLRAVIDELRNTLPDLSLTIDPVEYRGFEYQTGISFTVFQRGVRGELGRGGRYVTAGGEAATGFTILMDSVVRAITPRARRDRAFLPYGTAADVGADLRSEGWATVQGLWTVDDDAAEAQRLACSHVVLPGNKRPEPIGKDQPAKRKTRKR